MSRPEINYFLEVQEEPIEEEVLLKALEEIAEDQDMIIPDLKLLVQGTWVDTRWYREEEEKLFYPLSLQFPQSLFVLDVNQSAMAGGDSRIYYRNGQRAEQNGYLLYSPFHEDMLDYEDETPAIWSSPWIQVYPVASSPEDAPLYDIRDLNRRLIARVNADLLELVKSQSTAIDILVDCLRNLGCLAKEDPFENAAAYFDSLSGYLKETLTGKWLLKLIPEGVKQEHVDLMHLGCTIAGKFYLLTQDAERPKGRWPLPAKGPVDPEQVFKKHLYSEPLKHTLYLKWEKLEQQMNLLLSALLDREVKTEIQREDFYYWKIQIVPTPLTGKEVKFLLDAVAAEPELRNETLCFGEAEADDAEIWDLPEELGNQLLAKTLPFPLGTSRADDHGVWMISQTK